MAGESPGPVPGCREPTRVAIHHGLLDAPLGAWLLGAELKQIFRIQPLDQINALYLRLSDLLLSAADLGPSLGANVC